MERKTFEKGMRVMTPEGEGEVLENHGTQIDVKLDSGEEKTYTLDQLEDDSDAG